MTLSARTLVVVDRWVGLLRRETMDDAVNVPPPAVDPNPPRALPSLGDLVAADLDLTDATRGLVAAIDGTLLRSEVLGALEDLVVAVGPAALTILVGLVPGGGTPVAALVALVARWAERKLATTPPADPA